MRYQFQKIGQKLLRSPTRNRRRGLLVRSQRDHRLRMEPLEPRQMLTTIVPQQFSGLIQDDVDILWIRGNVFDKQLTTSTVAINANRNAIADYYERNSAGITSIDAFDITPIYNITSTITNINQLATALRGAAQAGGFNLSSYDRVAYHFPNPPSSVPFPGGALGSGNGASGQMWIPDGALGFSPGVVHESIHTLGLGHAEHIEGGDQIFPGTVIGGLDPYHFMGSEGPNQLDVDMPVYMKYYIGWLGASNVTVAPEDPTGTYRIYTAENTTLDANRKVALQLGDRGETPVWLSYAPDTQNPFLETHGVLAHYLPPQSPAVTRLLDLNPEPTPDADLTFDEQRRYPLADLWDAAAVVGQTTALFDYQFTPVATGGVGVDAWVDIEVRRAEVLTVDLGESEYHYDFGPEGSPLLPGFTRITPLTAGDIRWNQPVTAELRSSGTNNERDFVTGTDATTLEHKIANGTWQVTLKMGDADLARDDMAVTVEGVAISSDIDSPAGQFSYVDASGASVSEVSFEVEVTDGSITFEFDDNGGVDLAWVLNELSLVQQDTGVDPEQLSFDYDFGPVGSTVESGFQLISPDTSGDIEWSGAIDAIDRGAFGATPITRDFVTSTETRTLEHKISNGTWRVTLQMGDSFFAHDNMSVMAEGQLITDGIDSAASKFPYITAAGTDLDEATFDVAVNDGSLSLQFGDADGASSGDNGWVATRMSLRRVSGSAADLENQFEFRYDFGHSYSPVEPGYSQLSPEDTMGDIRWTAPVESRDRYSAITTNAPDPINRDFILSATASTLEHKIANGTWRVTLTMGDRTNAHDNMRVRAEGITINSDIDSQINQIVYVTTAGESLVPASFDVTVNDGSLTLDFDDLGGNIHWVLNSMVLQRVDIPGDFNGNETVDGLDLAKWTGDFGQGGGSDADGDGDTDGADFLTWQRNFGQSVAPAPLSNAVTDFSDIIVEPQEFQSNYVFDQPEVFPSFGGCSCGGIGCPACSTASLANPGVELGAEPTPTDTSSGFWVGITAPLSFVNSPTSNLQASPQLLEAVPLTFEATTNSIDSLLPNVEASVSSVNGQSQVDSDDETSPEEFLVIIDQVFSEESFAE